MRFNKTIFIKILKLSILSIISFYFLLITVKDFDFSFFIESLLHLDLKYIFLGCLCLLFGNILRSLRWKYFSLKKKSISNFSTFAKYNYFIGNSLNCFLPFRAGDVYRIYLFKNYLKINYLESLTLIFFERLMDVAILSMIIIFLSYWLNLFDYFSSNLVFILLILFFLSLLIIKLNLVFVKKIIFLIFKILTLKKLVKVFLNLLNLIRLQLSNYNFSLIYFFTFFGWIFESLCYLFIIKSFSIDITILNAIFICAFTTLSTMIPSLPGHIGTFHFFNKFALVMVGIDPIISLSITLFTHMILWINILFYGFFYYIKKKFFSDLIFNNSII